MLSVSAPSRTRSSLEEMLESLKQRDENEKPKDIPPALPTRPKSASRTRPPSPKRTLPNNTTGNRGVVELENGKKEEVKGKRGNMFGAKKGKEMIMEFSESPYVNSFSVEKEYRQRFWEKDGAKLLDNNNRVHYSLPKFREDEWNDNISYFIEKVKKEITVKNCVLCSVLYTYDRFFVALLEWCSGGATQTEGWLVKLP